MCSPVNKHSKPGACLFRKLKNLEKIQKNLFIYYFKIPFLDNIQFSFFFSFLFFSFLSQFSPQIMHIYIFFYCILKVSEVVKYQTQLHGHQWGSDQSTCHAKVQQSLLLYIRVMSFYMGCDCGCSVGRIVSVLSVEQHVISVMCRCTPCPQRPPAQMLHLPPLTACTQLPDRGLSQQTLPPLLLITHDRIPNNRLCAASARAAMFIAPDT